MKNRILVASLLLITSISYAQNDNETNRFIEVIGSAEREFEPDEIKFIIGIEEYWLEEFDKKSDFKDYKTKVGIAQIENDLLVDLKKIGISKDNIRVLEIGNYWRYKGKEFLISKQLEITLHDFKKINDITSIVNTKGIDYMRIGELKNKNSVTYRKEVKTAALIAAKEKAAYLLSALDKEIGDVISITELTNDMGVYRPQAMMSNTIMNSPGGNTVDNFRKIKLRYEIRAKFEIK